MFVKHLCRLKQGCVNEKLSLLDIEKVGLTDDKGPQLGLPVEMARTYCVDGGERARVLGLVQNLHRRNSDDRGN